MKPCCEQVKAAAMEAMDKIMGDMKYTTNTIQRSYTIEAIADIRVEFNLLLSQLESESEANGLDDAIDRHVKRSAKAVAKIPRKNRSIISKSELESEASDE